MDADERRWERRHPAGTVRTEMLATICSRGFHTALGWAPVSVTVLLSDGTAEMLQSLQHDGLGGSTALPIPSP